MQNAREKNLTWEIVHVIDGNQGERQVVLFNHLVVNSFLVLIDQSVPWFLQKVTSNVEIIEKKRVYSIPTELLVSGYCSNHYSVLNQLYGAFNIH